MGLAVRGRWLFESDESHFDRHNVRASAEVLCLSSDLTRFGGLLGPLAARVDDEAPAMSVQHVVCGSSEGPPAQDHGITPSLRASAIAARRTCFSLSLKPGVRALFARFKNV